MSVKLLTEHHLDFKTLKEAAQARLSLHLSKCHIFGNHMSRLIYVVVVVVAVVFVCFVCASLFSKTTGPLVFHMPGFVSMVSPTWKCCFIMRIIVEMPITVAVLTFYEPWKLMLS